VEVSCAGAPLVEGKEDAGLHNNRLTGTFAWKARPKGKERPHSELDRQKLGLENFRRGISFERKERSPGEPYEGRFREAETKLTTEFDQRHGRTEPMQIREFTQDHTVLRMTLGPES